MIYLPETFLGSDIFGAYCCANILYQTHSTRILNHVWTELFE